MSNIPQADPCRFITISEIKQRILDDNFAYKAVRIIGKIKQLQDAATGLCVFEGLEASKDTILVDTFDVRRVAFEVGKVYELLGEI